jgi:hypothetical protein
MMKKKKSSQMDDWDWYWEVIAPYSYRHRRQIEDAEFEDIPDSASVQQDT